MTDDASSTSTSTSGGGGGEAAPTALGSAADAAGARFRAAGVGTGGPGFHVLSAERQPGACSVNSLQLVERLATHPVLPTHANGAATKPAVAAGAAAAAAATTAAAAERFPRWVVAVCGLSVRFLEGPQLRCALDLGNSQRRSKTLAKGNATWPPPPSAFCRLQRARGWTREPGRGLA